MAIKANLLIDQGTTFSSTINITDVDGEIIDLSGYTGASQMRKHYSSSNSTAFSVTITAATGEVTLSLSSNQTANLTAGRYVYDVELTDSSNVISRVLEGIVTVSPNVTR